MRTSIVAAATTLTLLVAPGAATGVAVAGEARIPPLPTITGSTDSCAVARGEFRSAVTTARKVKRAAYRRARLTWLAATKDERVARRSALIAAESKREVKEALRAFRHGVADEREARQDAKADARTEYRMTVKSAGKELRRDLRNC